MDKALENKTDLTLMQCT